MRPRVRVGALALFAACLAAPAVAQPAYKASDIVSRFAPSVDLGAPRALCIGTASECQKDVAPPKPAGNFDLVVNFEYNSDILTRSARSNLDEFAKALKDSRLASASFVVEGHTDGAGGEAFNLDLSARRAKAVVGYLRSRGVPSSKLDAKGFGKQRLLVSDPMSSANRRVETRLRTE